MNPRTWFRVSRSAVSAAVFFLSSSACLVSVAGAQSADQAAAELPHAPFLSAPSFPLAGAPTSVATGDLNGDGKLDLVTTNWSSGKVTVSLGIGNGKFAAGVDYAVGAHPGSAIIADIDGDGRADVIVANQSDNTIRVLLGSGNGKLQSSQSYSLGFSPAAIAVGDFNGDGKLDIAVSGGSTRLLAVLLNDGRGGLGKPQVRSLAKVPTALAIADMNGDDHADLALANADGTISILLGAGDGSFRSAPDVKVAQGPLSSILAGDFNRDGKVDLAVTLSGQKQLSILMGKGDGGFEPSASYRVGSNPVSILMGDIDEDGIPDLVVTNQGSNTFSILGGNGDGTFRSLIDYVAGKGPLAAVAGDFYGGGHLDLAIINYASQTVTMPLGNGDGTFRAARAYTVELQPKAVATGDLTGRKSSDLVVTNFCGSDAACAKGGTVSVLLAGANGSYSLGSSYALGSGPVAVALLDVDGDKNLDIVALNRTDKTISILLGLGGDSFQQQFTLPLGESPIAFAVGDFNHDGKADLAVLGDCGAAKCSQPGSLEILYGGGDGSFRSARTYPVDYAPTALAVGDLNNDKSLDIVVSNACGKAESCNGPGTATIFLGSATGKFTPGQDVALGNGPSSIALGDLSGRKVLDLLVSRSTDNTLAVLRGNGDGTFQAPALYKSGTAPGPVVVADFNGDGKPDVAVGNGADSTVSVFFGKGDGTLLPATTFPVGPGPESLTAVPGAGGGLASLVTANGNSASSTMGTDVTVLANIHPDIIGSTPTSVGLVAAPTTAAVNDAVTLTATVTSTGAPTGNVTFTSTPNTIADCNGTSSNIVSVTGATATTSTAVCVTHSLQAPGQSVTAKYNGDTIYAVSTSSPATAVTVTPLTGTLKLTPTASSVAVNGTVTFNASFTASATTPIAPSGTVSFQVNGASSADCPDQLITAPASCTPASLTVGHGTVTATYSGDDNFTFAGMATSTVTVTPIAGTLTLTPSTGTTSVNGSVTFTAAFSATPTSPIAPSGTVSYKINGATSSDCPDQPITGATTCTTKSLTVGHGTVTASYGNDNNFTAPGATSTVTVNPLAATVHLSAVTPTPTVDQSVMFTASVTASSETPTSPSGNVIFTLTSSATPICTSPLNASGQATCTTTALIAPADNVTATYAGDTNFTVTGTSGTVTVPQSVSKATAQTQLASSLPTSSQVNQSVTFTATVTPPASGATTIEPGGSVTFSQGGTTLCGSVTLSNAQPPTASCPHAFSAVSPGVAITATYNADTNFNSGTPGTFNQVVTAAGTQISASASPASPNLNQMVTFSASLVAVPSGSALPSAGTVVFKDTSAATTLCTSTITTPGVVPTCTSSFGTAGTHDVTATYNSTDSNFTGSTSSALPISVGAGGATVTITSSLPLPGGSAVDQQVTFSSTVTSASSGSAVPQGTVTYRDTLAGTNLCTVTLSGGSVPDCKVALTSAGTHTITASFTTSDANFSNGTSPVLFQLVNAAATTTTLTSSPSTSSVDQSVSFTATVTPAFAGSAHPTGTVAFTYSANGNTLTLCGSAQAVVTTGSVTTATCSAPLIASGARIVTATYAAGDSNFSASSTTLSQQVNKTNTTAAITSITPSPSGVNQVVSFNASVTTAFSDAGLTVPTGTVTVSDSVAGVLCTSVLATNGSVPACTAALLTQGTHNITASYAGDVNFNAAPASAVFHQVVNSASTQVALSSSSPTANVNDVVVFTATLATTPSGSALPSSGSVLFSDTLAGITTTLCTNPISSAGVVPPCSVSFSAPGAHSITATFTSTDANFGNGTSPSFTETIRGTGTSVVLQSSPNPSAVNQPVTFSAAVVSSTAGTTVPQGTVAYTDGAKVLCTNALTANGSVPACTVSLATFGNHSIKATFTSTTSSFTDSISQILNQNVIAPSTTVALSSSPAASVVDQQVTFTATITPQFPGTTNPTGTVTFTYSLAGSTITLCSQPQPVTTSGTSVITSQASCTAPIPATGSYVVTAAYTSGDTNFTAGPSASITQSVTAGNTVVTLNTPSISPSLVNQSVSFSAVLTPAISDTNLIAPTGSVTFFDAGTIALCTSNVTNGIVGKCSAPLGTAGDHSITAVYSGDGNFKASPTSKVFTQTVQPTPTTVTVASSNPSSIATNQVTLTASVVPAFPGATAPTGTVTFQIAQGANMYACNGSPATLSTNGTLYTSSCTISFPATLSGPVSASAIYSGDLNFQASSGSTTQTVQNFAFAFSTPGPILITQGYTNANDPFATNTITAISTPSSGFSDNLTLNCVVTNSKGLTVSDPSCSPAHTTLAASGSAPLPYVFSASATAATGAYTVTVTAASQTTPALSQTATTSIYVVGLSGPLSLSPNASGTENASFNTVPVSSTALTSLSSFNCAGIVNATDGSPASLSSIKCAFSSNTVSVTNGAVSTLVPISITVEGNATASSAPQKSSTTALAALWGVPLLAILVWFGNRKSPRRNFFRFLGLLLLIIGIGHAIGCGGSFKQAVIPTSPVKPGNYLVQVVATGNDGHSYYAVVPLSVN